ncbi:CARDB domain-containing protein [Aquimarina mytili]|uniref:CARDB domain-containing protein n=1 Tax=Aquimarina mytili TaxID=874423 RepID=A0A936ZWD4_9FLAO|nr:CARDB domain-containing protein [Aquimarina mytili]MBL0685507.1 hypothetical protein [Aquimarina mytili]
MFGKIKFLIIIFCITFINHSIAHGTESDFEKIIDVTINTHTGRIEIDESQVQDLHVFIWGKIQFNVYGLYQNTYPRQSVTEKRFNISSTIINTTLTPILIPPTRPDPDDRTINNDRILLGTMVLDLLSYDVTPGLKTVTLSLSEVDTTIVDQRDVSFNVYNPEQLGDLEITHAETVIPNIDRIQRKVQIKAHIRNTGRDDINEKSKVKFYIKIEDKLKLLKTKTVGPISENNSKSCIIFIDYETYSKIIGKTLYIIVDEDNHVRERSDFNNYLNYTVPEIQVHPNTIKTYPNPFKDEVNFTFFLGQDAAPLVVLKLYNRFGMNIATQGYVLSPNNTYQTITYFNDNLSTGMYIYTLTVGDMVYQGTIVK